MMNATIKTFSLILFQPDREICLLIDLLPKFFIHRERYLGL